MPRPRYRDASSSGTSHPIFRSSVSSSSNLEWPTTPPPPTWRRNRFKSPYVPRAPARRSSPRINPHSPLATSCGTSALATDGNNSIQHSRFPSPLGPRTRFRFDRGFAHLGVDRGGARELSQSQPLLDAPREAHVQR